MREALVDFVECEPIGDEDADVSELAIQHIEKEIDRCEAEYVSICFCLIDGSQYTACSNYLLFRLCCRIDELH